MKALTEIKEVIESLKAKNEKIGWKAAHSSGSNAGAGHVLGYRNALDDLLSKLNIKKK